MWLPSGWWPHALVGRKNSRRPTLTGSPGVVILTGSVLVRDGEQTRGPAAFRASRLLPLPAERTPAGQNQRAELLLPVRFGQQVAINPGIFLAAGRKAIQGRGVNAVQRRAHQAERDHRDYEQCHCQED